MDETLYVRFNQFMLLKVAYFNVQLAALLSKIRLDGSFRLPFLPDAVSVSQVFLAHSHAMLLHSSLVAYNCWNFTAHGRIPFPFFFCSFPLQFLGSLLPPWVISHSIMIATPNSITKCLIVDRLYWPYIVFLGSVNDYAASNDFISMLPNLLF